MKDNYEKINTILLKITNGNQALVDKWLETPLEEYFNLSPNAFMQLQKGNDKIVFDNIKSSVHGEAMGS